MDEVKANGRARIAFSEPQIDIAKLRGHKEKVIGKLTGGLAGMAKARKVSVLGGRRKISRPLHLEVSAKRRRQAQGRKVRQGNYRGGSQAIKLPFIPDDPRVVDSTGALELRQIPKSMLVIGGVSSDFEMATVYSTLGTRIDVVEDARRTDDRCRSRTWSRCGKKKNAGRFDKVMLKTKMVSAEATPDGIKVGFEGEKAPTEPQLYDMCWSRSGAARTARKSTPRRRASR